MKKKAFIGIAAALVVVAIVAGGIGYRAGSRGKAPDEPASQSKGSPNGGQAAPEKPTVWTCSMHTQIRLPKPGLCPLCPMDLIPLKADDGNLKPRQLKLSPAAMKLAGIQVAPAEHKAVEMDVRMVGKIAYDETRLADITSRVGGRLDRLYVDYTGVPVKKGDHLVYLYSPAMVSAQEELLQSLKTVKELAQSDVAIVRETAQATVAAAREKLRLWGLSKEQVQAIETSGKVEDHLTVYSPLAGIVIKKYVNQGAYVKEGTRIYTIADLSSIWAQLDAYESDLAWLRYRQEVEFVTEAYPGRTFKGVIAFINPVLNPKTRTVKVRVNIDNKDGLLKPHMFVRAVVRVKASADGVIPDQSLAGKWISPMHPEVISDKPGKCTVCGMALVKAEELGYVKGKAKSEFPLVIPATAPLFTGKRSVVYVEVGDGVYEGRTITLGMRAGNYYLVKEGLFEGELVVTNGNFKLDSALQIQAKPSMMNPKGGGSGGGHQHHGSKPKHSGHSGHTAHKPKHGKLLKPMLDEYLKLQVALAADQLDPAKVAAGELQKQVASLKEDQVPVELREIWGKNTKRVEDAAGKMAAAKDIEVVREQFDRASSSMIKLAKAFGVDRKVSVINCSMAFDNIGADWLQVGDQIANPYFGKSMLRCGTTTEVLE